MKDHAAKRLGAGIAAGPAVAVRRRRPVSASSVAGRSATLRRSAAVMLTRAPPVLAHARTSLPPGYCRIVMLVASSPLTWDRLQAERVPHDRYACRSVGLSAPFGRSGPAGPRPTVRPAMTPEGVPSGGRSGSAKNPRVAPGGPTDRPRFVSPASFAGSLPRRRLAVVPFEALVPPRRNRASRLLRTRRGGRSTASLPTRRLRFVVRSEDRKAVFSDAVAGIAAVSRVRGMSRSFRGLLHQEPACPLRSTHQGCARRASRATDFGRTYPQPAAIAVDSAG
jgi:hypothetical protein